jgi:hypothetical protein
MTLDLGREIMQKVQDMKILEESGSKDTYYILVFHDNDVSIGEFDVS